MAAVLDLMTWQSVMQTVQVDFEAQQPMYVPYITSFDGQCWFNGPPSPSQGDYFAMFPASWQCQDDCAAAWGQAVGAQEGEQKEALSAPRKEEQAEQCRPDCWNEPGCCEKEDVAEESTSKEDAAGKLCRKPRRRGRRRNKTAKAAAAQKAQPELPPGQVASDEPGSTHGFEASLQPAKDACEVLLDIEKDTLISRLEAEDTREASLELLLKELLPMALNKDGCRVVQKALDVADSTQRSKLLAAIQPHVVSLYQSPHGNYVITKVIQQLPAANLGGIVSELEKQGFEEVAKHRFGCRVLERLIEHCEEKDLIRLIEVVKAQAAVLSRHQYANFVVQHLFEHSPSQRSALLSSFLKEVPQLAMHRHASHVVQRALSYSEKEDQHALIQTMLKAEGETTLEKVAVGRYGNYVVEQLAETLLFKGAVCQRIEAAKDELGHSELGARVLQKFGVHAH
eukprot:TRINITY_DN4118_c0_g1_i1.p1 TRINITY_DN4118_c0_g1~~TRINITY_DN4118_c0_g1_i1.p1  ORF type:complete len:454 (-),score=135.00 TRINITY_DN4118_c0_g1_i1:92-1453(-)